MARRRRGGMEQELAPHSSADLDKRATPTAGSILDIVRRMKEQIVEKDRIITEKTHELKEARRHTENIFASMADAVVVLDAHATIESVNQAALDLLGYERDDLIGESAARLWADPAHAAIFEGSRYEDLLRRGALQRSDMAWRTSRGQSIPVSWHGAPLLDGDRLLGLVGIARDIRIDKKLEEEKLRAVRALAASVAHEIRNPLGAIQNSVALLKRDLPLQGDDETLMQIVFDEAQRIGAIVNQFLSFARPSEPMLAAGDIAPLVREVVTLAEKDERAQAGTELLVATDPDLPSVGLDGDKVKQVLWNLIGNALDACQGTGRQGGHVAIRTRSTPDGGVEVRVADDGPGMPPEVLSRAFEPFRTTKARGTGLGLAISKSIIEAHGGTIRLESARGQGTSVTFTLPPWPEPKPPEPKPPEPKPPETA